jgi:hypothetical protein
VGVPCRSLKKNPFSPGPFKNDEAHEDIKLVKRGKPPRSFVHESNYREMVEYLENRLNRLPILKNTSTPRGQLLDWIPIESQYPKGLIASPPRGRFTSPNTRAKPNEPKPGRRHRAHPPQETRFAGLRQSLKKYLSKTRGHRIARVGGTGFPAPEEDGSPRYGSSGQSTLVLWRRRPTELLRSLYRNLR